MDRTDDDAFNSEDKIRCRATCADRNGGGTETRRAVVGNMRTVDWQTRA